MNNHIYRHGLMPKKTTDGRRYTYLHKERPGPRPAPDYERTYVSHSESPPGCCGFQHAPYVSKIVFGDARAPKPHARSGHIWRPLLKLYRKLKEARDRNLQDSRSKGWDASDVPPAEAQSTDNDHEPSEFVVSTTIARLISGAKTCGFCSVLWLGLQQYLPFWKGKFNRFMYLDYLADHAGDYSEEMYYSLAAENLFGEIAVLDRPFDESKINVMLSLDSEKGYIQLRLMIEPYEKVTWARKRPLMVLEYFTLKADPSPWKAFGPTSQVSADVLSEPSIQLIKGWIDDCRIGHAPCNPVRQSPHPARMLKVEHVSGARDPAVRLILVVAGQAYRYIALSHCWANSDPLKTTSENLQERLNHISWTDLPKMFQDTVSLAISLDVKYIWIDALCIIQGDEADWAIESPKMGAIYAGAYVVFAAHGPELGLTKEMHRCTDPDSTDTVRNAGDSRVFVRPSIDHDNLVNPPEDDKTWFGRAWCFQERLFGSRILHFGGTWEEMWFECSVHLRCECGEAFRLSKGSADHDGSTWNHQKAHFARTLQNSARFSSGQQAQKTWRMFVSFCETFTSQGLTNPQDTLVALSSLADVVSPYLGRYLAGLWEHNILIGLQWESVDGRESSRHSSYIAPSFSWASRTGAVVWYISDTYMKPDPEQCEFAQVLDMHCETSLQTPYGRVQGGHIRLRGYAVTMYFKDEEGCYSLGRLKIRPNAPAAGNEASTSNSQTQPEDADSCWVCMDAIEDMLQAKGRAVTCLDIMRDKGKPGYLSALVLVPAVERPGAYRRVGFSTIEKSFFHGAHLEELTII